MLQVVHTATNYQSVFVCECSYEHINAGSFIFFCLAKCNTNQRTVTRRNGAGKNNDNNDFHKLLQGNRFNYIQVA